MFRVDTTHIGPPLVGTSGHATCGDLGSHPQRVWVEMLRAKTGRRPVKGRRDTQLHESRVGEVRSLHACHVRAGQIGVDKRCAGQIGVHKERVGEVRAGEVRAGQIGLDGFYVGEVREGQIRKCQVRVVQVGAVEYLGAAEVGAGQVCAGQVRKA